MVTMHIFVAHMISANAQTNRCRKPKVILGPARHTQSVQLIVSNINGYFVTFWFGTFAILFHAATSRFVWKTFEDQ